MRSWSRSPFRANCLRPWSSTSSMTTSRRWHPSTAGRPTLVQVKRIRRMLARHLSRSPHQTALLRLCQRFANPCSKRCQLSRSVPSARPAHWSALAPMQWWTYQRQLRPPRHRMSPGRRLRRRTQRLLRWPSGTVPDSTVGNGFGLGSCRSFHSRLMQNCKYRPIGPITLQCGLRVDRQSRHDALAWKSREHCPPALHGD